MAANDGEIKPEVGRRGPNEHMPISVNLSAHEKVRITSLLNVSEYITANNLDLERDLYITKWFDYRFMSPEEATQIFADAYVKIYREIWKREFDRDAADAKRAIAVGGLYHNHREFVLMWNARRAADVLGTPYDLHIRHAMDIKLRLGWKTPPRPNQLCGDKKSEKMVPALQKRWDERRSSIRFTDLPVYRTENFAGFRAQLDHQAFVLERVASHGQRHWAAGSASVAKRLISSPSLVSRGQAAD